jgi:hypothetical protein
MEDYWQRFKLDELWRGWRNQFSKQKPYLRKIREDFPSEPVEAIVYEPMLPDVFFI